MGIWDYSTTPGNNGTISGINIAEGTAVIKDINNAQRQKMADIKAFAEDIGGSLTAGGTADALTLTTNGTLAALADGVMVAFVAASTNTGAATLAVDGLTAKAIRKQGDVALGAGDIVSGGHYVVSYDASANSAAGAWILHNPAVDVPDTGVEATLNTASNLKVDQATAATLTVTADRLALYDSNGHGRSFTSVSLTANIATSGANGLDTGAEAASTWYFVWVIGKDDGTVASLLSTSATSPTLPSGYTYKGRIGAIFNDSTSDFRGMYQRGRSVAAARTSDLSGGTATTVTAVTLTIPTTARIWHGVMLSTGATAGGDINITMQPTSGTTGPGRKDLVLRNQADTGSSHAPAAVQIVEAQTVYYINGSGDGMSIQTTGWEY